MNNFSFQNTTLIHFGPQQIAQIGQAIPIDKKVLVTFGGGSIKQNGVYDQVAKALEGHQWLAFGGIEPNPQFDTLIKAVELIKKENIDFVLAVGGGSVVDGSKFIVAASCYEGEDAWDILSKQSPVERALPLGVVLTLPATGSETNIGAVVSRGKDKLAFMNPLVRPQFAVLDPETTLSLSPRQSANGVVDAFVHVMEQYLTYSTDAKVQDRFAEGLLLTLIEEGPRVLSEPDNIDVRANIMWAATQALNGLIGVGVPQDWTTHMIGHELTGIYGIDHARTLSIVLPAVMKHRQDKKQTKLLQYAERVWGLKEGDESQRIEQAIEATINFFKAMQVPTSLRDAELTRDAIDTLLASLEKHGMVSLGEHGDIDIVESRKILETAF